MSVPVPVSRNQAGALPSFPQCIYAGLDEEYLTGAVIPELIARHFPPALKAAMRFRLIDRSRQTALASSSGLWKKTDLSQNLLALHAAYVFSDPSPKIVFVQSTPESNDDKEGLWARK